MLTRYFDEVNSSVNVDILYPLVRSFSRLNGSIEPADTTATTTQKEFIHTKVEFVHSMDGVTSIRGGLTYVRKLKRQAKFAAMGQYYRKSFVICGSPLLWSTNAMTFMCNSLLCIEIKMSEN